ncbi:hypothetical protein [Catellatospora vulcania]|uniref:hypothetical protein n=1 Tax=Catellatospora vulcania TaxID=1460450 RepID=UPI0012D3F48A|nr:hypothetical protein [Catellatospora vulcania]
MKIKLRSLHPWETEHHVTIRNVRRLGRLRSPVALPAAVGSDENDPHLPCSTAVRRLTSAEIEDKLADGRRGKVFATAPHAMALPSPWGHL